MSDKKIEIEKIKNRIIEILKQQAESEATFDKLYKDKTIIGSIEQTKYENNLRFKKLIKDIFNHNTKIHVTQNTVVYNKRYPKLKSYQSLIKLIMDTPEGLLIDQQILDFSYRKIKQDIQRALKSNKARKHPSSNKKDFYLFPKSCENQDTASSVLYLGTEFYMKVCRQENPFSTTNNSLDADNNSSKGKKSDSAWNSWVPGYIDAKKQWMKKNNAKKS